MEHAQATALLIGHIDKITPQTVHCQIPFSCHNLIICLSHNLLIYKSTAVITATCYVCPLGVELVQKY